MTNAAIYTRYSSGRQTDDTLAVQAQACKNYAKANDYHVVSVYSDAATSGTSEYRRTQFLQMIEDAKEGHFSAVIVYKWDRMGRSLIDATRVIDTLKKAGVKALSATEPENDLSRDILLAVAADFSRQLSERVIDAQTAAVLRGGPPGGKAPYGWKRVEGNIEPHPTEAPIVQRIFEYYLRGHGSTKISRILNEEKVPTSTGRKWSPAVVLSVLKNPCHIGHTAWGRRRKAIARTGSKYLLAVKRDQWAALKENTHAPIIATDDWDRVQEKMRKRTEIRPGRGRGRWGNHALSGFVVCQACGAPCALDGNRPQPRYRCGKRIRHGDCENSSSIKKADIEEQVIGYVSKTLLSDQYIEAAQKSAEQKKPRIQSDLKTALADITKEIDRYVGPSDAVIHPMH